MRALLSFLVSVALGASSAAADSSYFPLSEGWQWEYIGSGGDASTAAVQGTRQVLGQPTIVLRRASSGEVDQQLDQFYTVDPDGSVLIHGFVNYSADLTRSFSPPLVLLPASLSVGDEWCGVVQEYGDLDGLDPLGEIEICFRVYSLDLLPLPVGEFEASGVGQFLPPGAVEPTREYHRLGYPTRRAIGAATEWYTAGVGNVAFDIYQYFELTSWVTPPTPNRRTRWSGLKRAFGSGVQP